MNYSISKSSSQSHYFQDEKYSAQVSSRAGYIQQYKWYFDQRGQTSPRSMEQFYLHTETNVSLPPSSPLVYVDGHDGSI